MNEDVRDFPQWVETSVKVTRDSGAVESRPALTHPWVPGLAIAFAGFGIYRVTHAESGCKLGGTYERLANAMVEFAEWAAIGRAYGLDWTGPAESISGLFIHRGGEPVPFGKHWPLRDWRETLPQDYEDEFPFDESDPMVEAEDMLTQTFAGVSA
jgi:hypothetical protein